MSSSTAPCDSTTTRLARNTASLTSWVMNSTVGRRCCPDAGQLLLQRHARLRVDAGERLVHQQHVGLVGQRAHHAHALLHAARQLVRIALGRVREAGERQVLARDLVALGLGHAAHLRARRRRCRAPCATGTARTTGTRRRGRAPARCTGRPSTRIWPAGRRQEAGDHVEHRRLAAARRADHRDEVAGVDRRARCRGSPSPACPANGSK